MLSIVDLCLIGLATLCAQLLRDSFETRPQQIVALLPYIGLTLAAAIPGSALFRLNQSIWRLSGMPDYLNVLGAAILTVAAAVGLGFLVNRLDGVARSLPVIQTCLIVLGLVGVRVVARLRHAGREKAATAPAPSVGREDILVVGINPITDLYLRSVAEYAAGRIMVIGLLADKENQAGRLMQGHRILGITEQIAGILADLEVHGVAISRVVVTLPCDRLSPAARAALRNAEESPGVRVEFFADEICGASRRAPGPALPSGLAGGTNVALLSIDDQSTGQTQRYYWRVKRALDVTIAACAIVALLPLLLLITVLVVIDVGAPAIFWQQRPGLGGWPFRLYKFRTMAPAYDADGRRIADAERLSFCGWLLRRLRLDELPQLFNIVIGEMSFIGPRPLLSADQHPGLSARLAVRPGITGWAQIKGGRQISASDKAALDIWYIRHAGVLIDLQIIVGTLRMVLLGERQVDMVAVQEAWRELCGNTVNRERSRSSVVQALPVQSSA